MSARSLGALVLLLFASAACTESERYQTAMCALVDVSGTYASEKEAVVKTIKTGILPEMLPGDSLSVIVIDSESYDQENLLTRLTTNYRPLEANAQKLAFASELDAFAASEVRSNLTDISGAMMLCADHLRSSEAGNHLMFIFSDMLEELPRGVERSFGADEFADMGIAAVNVIQLKGDNMQPAVYRQRLAEWERRVRDAGANDWKVILDPTEIPDVIGRYR